MQRSRGSIDPQDAHAIGHHVGHEKKVSARIKAQIAGVEAGVAHLVGAGDGWLRAILERTHLNVSRARLAFFDFIKEGSRISGYESRQTVATPLVAGAIGGEANCISPHPRHASILSSPGSGKRNLFHSFDLHLLLVPRTR